MSTPATIEGRRRPTGVLHFNQGNLASWDLRTAKLLYRKKIHSHGIPVLAQDKGGRFMAIGSQSGSVTISYSKVVNGILA